MKRALTFISFLFLIIFVAGCSMFGGSSKRSVSTDSSLGLAACIDNDWSKTAYYPCSNCSTQANSTGTATADHKACNCISGFTWNNGMCSGSASTTTVCPSNTWSNDGYVPVGGTCNSCSSVLNSPGTSNASHTACDCNGGYGWSGGTCDAGAACPANTWSNTGLVPTGGSCSSCSTSAVAHSAGTSNTTHTGCNCVAGYTWSGTSCVASAELAARLLEIRNAAMTNISSVMEAGQYKYGDKSPAPVKTFDINKVKVLADACGASGENCTVNVFIDKSSALRPVFVIDGRVNPTLTNGCDPKYQAYIRSVVMLTKEALKPATTSPNYSSAATACSGIASTRDDYLCKHQSIPGISITKSSAFTLSGLGFDAAVGTPAESILKIDYSSNSSLNLICINKMFRPSLYNKSRNTGSVGYTPVRTDIAVFSVKLVMKQ